MTPRRISRDQVLDVTWELATRKGLPAVTMRAVAQELDVNPMTLYRHVGDKQGLLDGLVERLLLEIEVPGPGLDWREQLRLLADSMRATARRHPDLFLLLFQRPAATPEAFRPRNAVYDALHAAGVAEERIPQVERLLATFMLGFAASEAGGRFRDGDPDDDMAFAEQLIVQAIAGA
ncbi:TetR/AcrR family transcriptional regulator C-terminal domain-containing protein [Streptomyces sp. NPDC005492]|uniref:TetR/AcrR family transcriptional regulator n=1 Tax=Streptomyces sp. NPDC005492 TaxID=3156883 RepID=UPI0033B73C8F